MNKREQQRHDRREQILNCSLDMIINRGYEAMTIRDIANKLEISTGLFFNYFESKERVYEELVKIGISGPESLFKLDFEQSTPIEIFTRMTEEIFNSIKAYSMTAKMFILMAQTMKSETVPDSVKKVIKEFDAITPIIPLVKRGQELGEIKIGDPVALLVAYWGAVQGVAENIAVRPELTLPESSWIVDILRA